MKKYKDSLALSINLYFLLVTLIFPTHNVCSYFRTHLDWKSRGDKDIQDAEGKEQGEKVKKFKMSEQGNLRYWRHMDVFP